MAGYGYRNRGYPDENRRRPIIPQTSPNNNSIYSEGYNNNVTEYGYTSAPPITAEPVVIGDYGVQPTRPGFLPSATNWRSNPSTYPGASPGYGSEFGEGYNTNRNRQQQQLLPASTGYVNRSNPSNYPGASSGYDYESGQGYNVNNNRNRQQQVLPSTGYVNRNDEISRDNNYRSGRNDGRITSHGQAPSPLSEPTNDIGKAMEILKESAAAASSTLVPRRGAYNYPETISTSDPARRYGNFNLSSRPVRTRGQF